jgi:hypothetical protein
MCEKKLHYAQNVLVFCGNFVPDNQACAKEKNGFIFIYFSCLSEESSVGDLIFYN